MGEQNEKSLGLGKLRFLEEDGVMARKARAAGCHPSGFAGVLRPESPGDGGDEGSKTTSPS